MMEVRLIVEIINLKEIEAEDIQEYVVANRRIRIQTQEGKNGRER